MLSTPNTKTLPQGNVPPLNVSQQPSQILQGRSGDNPPTSTANSISYSSVNSGGQVYTITPPPPPSGSNGLPQAISMAQSTPPQYSGPLPMNSAAMNPVAPFVAPGSPCSATPQQQYYSQIQPGQFPPPPSLGAMMQPSKKAGALKKYTGKAKGFAKPAGLIAGAIAVEGAGLTAGVDVLGGVAQIAKAYNTHKASQAQRLRLQNNSNLQSIAGGQVSVQVPSGQLTPSGQPTQPVLTPQSSNPTQNPNTNSLQSIAQQNPPPERPPVQESSNLPVVATSPHNGNQNASIQPVHPGQAMYQQQATVQLQQSITESHISTSPNNFQMPITPGPLQIRSRKALASTYANERPGGLPDLQHLATHQPNHGQQSGSNSIMKYPQEILQVASKLQHLLEKHHTGQQQSHHQDSHQLQNSVGKALIKLLKKMLHDNHGPTQSTSSGAPSTQSVDQSPWVSGSPSNSQDNPTLDIVESLQEQVSNSSIAANFNQGSAFSPTSPFPVSAPQVQGPQVDEPLPVSANPISQSYSATATPSSPIPVQQEVVTQYDVASTENDTSVVEDDVALVDLSSLGGVGFDSFSSNSGYYAQEATVYTSGQPAVNSQSADGVGLGPTVYSGTPQSVTNTTTSVVYSDSQEYATTSNGFYSSSNTGNNFTSCQSGLTSVNTGTAFYSPAVQNTSYGTVANYPSVGNSQLQSTSLSTQEIDTTSTTVDTFTAITDVTEVTQDTSDSCSFDTAPSLTGDDSEGISASNWASPITDVADGSIFNVLDDSNGDSLLDDQSAGDFLDSSFLDATM